MQNILITICARGGSKGIPGKNIKTLAGYPLIYYTLKLAAEFSSKVTKTNIVLSTDNVEIKNVVDSFRLAVDTEYSRPPYLANDTAGKLDAIIDVKQYMTEKLGTDYNYVIDLDVTSPLRSFLDIKNALDLLSSRPDAYNLCSVSPANRNPYFNMLEENEDGYYSLCKEGSFLSRQSAPQVFDMNASFYIFRQSFFNQRFKTVITDKTLVYEVPHVCFDLDHPIDFEIMSFLLCNEKLDFDFNR